MQARLKSSEETISCVETHKINMSEQQHKIGMLAHLREESDSVFSFVHVLRQDVEEKVVDLASNRSRPQFRYMS
jgi:hypothetical protein